MGSIAEVNNTIHRQHVQYIRNKVDHVGWIRRRKVEIPREIFDEEIDGFSDGFVDLVLSLCGVEAPGFPAMFGIGTKFVNVPGTDTVSGDIYYYSAFEVGSKLSHREMAVDKYSENENIVDPPGWLYLPFIEDYEETPNGEVAKDSAEGAADAAKDDDSV